MLECENGLPHYRGYPVRGKLGGIPNDVSLCVQLFIALERQRVWIGTDYLLEMGSDQTVSDARVDVAACPGLRARSKLSKTSSETRGHGYPDTRACDDSITLIVSEIFPRGPRVPKTCFRLSVSSMWTKSRRAVQDILGTFLRRKHSYETPTKEAPWQTFRERCH